MGAYVSSKTSAQLVVRKYQGYGLFAGASLGIVIGILLSGPHFFEWSAGESLEVILGCAAIGAWVGWIAPASASWATATESGSWSDGLVVGDGTGGDAVGFGGGDCGGGDGGGDGG